MPGTVLVIVDKAGTDIGLEAAFAYRDAGAAVTIGHPVHDIPHVPPELRSNITSMVLDPFKGSGDIFAKAGGKVVPKFETVIVSWQDAVAADAAQRSPEGGPLALLDESSWGDAVRKRPLAAYRLLRDLLTKDRLCHAARIAFVVPPQGASVLSANADGWVDRAGLRSLAGMVRELAQQMPESSATLAVVCTGWGRHEDGEPNRHSRDETTARALQETVGRLDATRHGQVLDLYGGLLSVIL
jgi:hypothetical protein